MGKKKKQEIEQLFSGITVFTALLVYLNTNSVFITIITSVLIILIGFTLAFIMNEIKNEKLKRSGILEIDKMKGHQFEYYLQALFQSKGYNAKVTKASGDYGADLILTKNKEKIVIQAKRYKSNVGIKAVQEIYSAKSHYDADQAWVVTNSYYTAAAKNLSKSNNVRLIDRDQLMVWSSELKSKKK